MGETLRRKRKLRGATLSRASMDRLNAKETCGWAAAFSTARTRHRPSTSPLVSKYPGYQSKCARDAALDFQVLDTCKNGSEGGELLHQNGVETDSLVPMKLGVPWIVFNKNWDPILQDQAQDDLKATCCKLAPKDTPACQ